MLAFSFRRIHLIALGTLWLVSFSLYAQPSSAAIDSYYAQLRRSFDGRRALEIVSFVEKRWRLAGNAGFNESIFEVEKILRDAGFKKEVHGESDGPLTYRIEKRTLDKPTWEPVTARVTLAGETLPLLDFSTNRNMIAIHSRSTPEEGITAEVINIGEGSRGDLEKRNVEGKIVFAERPAAAIYKLAMEKGAAGVLAYSMPSYTQPSKNIHSIQFQSIPYADSLHQKWAIMLSYAAKEKLKAALARGAVLATVNVTTRIYPSEELTLVANVRGASHPEERFVFSAHVQEPGANDNASGVGTLAEMARVTAQLVQQKAYTPERTITFLWGDEIVSTGRYIRDDAARAKGIKWGLSLDMVGENTRKTGGTFLIEKMPDPSAIWTRGKEKHTEWGGATLQESQLFPHYFNDLLLNRCLQQARSNTWTVNTNPFEGGSDHTPFLQARIPGLLMWHFTDVYYHTDADRLDMVSGEEMTNVGISALATAFTLCAADESTTLFLIGEIMGNAAARLRTESDLSRKAIADGSSLENERHILDVWTRWYERALELMNDIPVMGASAKTDAQISRARTQLKELHEKLSGELQAGK